jgi:hypothetical protein
MKKKNLKYLILPVFLLISLTCSFPGGVIGYDEKRPSEIPETQNPQLIPLPSEMLASPMPTLTAPPVSAVALSKGEDIRRLMLFSHQRWQSLWVDGTHNYYAGDGSVTPVQSNRIQVWIIQPAQVRMLSGPEGGVPETMWVSDGNYYRENNNSAQLLPDFSQSPFSPPVTFSDTIYPHPLDGMIGTPFGAMLFPAGLAQRAGFYNIVGEETIVGRRAVTVEWGREEGVIVDRFWIDTQTGIILRWLNFSKPGGQAIYSEMYVNSILINPNLPEQAFSLNNLKLSAFASGSMDIPQP